MFYTSVAKVRGVEILGALCWLVSNFMVDKHTIFFFSMHFSTSFV